MGQKDWKLEIDDRLATIRSEIRETPLEYSPSLSKLCGAEVYLKLENYQLTGSFKLRGVMSKLATLTDDEISKGLIACSTGNHGAGFAYAVDKNDHKGLLFLPHNVSKAKLEALRSYKVELDFFGEDCLLTEEHARKIAKERNQTLVHPYNDEAIVTGQGTIAAEIINQIGSQPDSIIVPIGGGGLISGIAAYIKQAISGVKVYGCQPENSAVMYHSLQAGKIIEEESLPTISDATAGGIEGDSITFNMCQQFVDDIFLLDESEIKSALRMIVEHHQMIVEGAAAMTLATLLKYKSMFERKRVVLILCGKKITREKLIECLR